MSTNATLDISIGVQYKKMEVDEPFTPTLVNTQPFHYISDLESYPEDLANAATEVYAFIASVRTQGCETSLNFDVRLDNPTAVPTGAGVVPMSKGHRNAGLTGEETTSAQVIEDTLNSIVLDLKQKAKY